MNSSINMALVESLTISKTKLLLNSLLKHNNELREIFFYIIDSSNGKKSIELEIELNSYMLTKEFYKFNGYITVRILATEGVETATLLHFRKTENETKKITKLMEELEVNKIFIDEVFTREVANNIWSFKKHNYTTHAVGERLAQLLLWDNEKYIMCYSDKNIVYKKKRKKIAGMIPFVKKIINIRDVYKIPKIKKTI